jgi:hypothetical protein
MWPHSGAVTDGSGNPVSPTCTGAHQDSIHGAIRTPPRQIQISTANTQEIVAFDLRELKMLPYLIGQA